MLSTVLAKNGYLRLTYTGAVGVSGESVQQSWDLTQIPKSVRDDASFKNNFLVVARAQTVNIFVKETVAFLPATGTPEQLVLEVTTDSADTPLYVDIRLLHSINGADGDGPQLYFIPAAESTTGALNLYVRDADGDDTNDGLTASTPVKTMQAAIDKVPLTINHPVYVHIGEHSGAGYTWPKFAGRTYNDVLCLLGDGGGGPTDGLTVTLTTEAAAAGTNAGMIVSSTGGHTVNEFRGHVVEILTGACAGYKRTIHSNTATDIIFVNDTDWQGLVPAQGDQFRIVRPAVKIQVVAGGGQHVSGVSKAFTDDAGGTGGGLLLHYLHFFATTTSEIIFSVHTAFYGVEQERTVAGTFNFVFHGIAGMFGDEDSGTNDADTPARLLGAPDKTAWAGLAVFRVDSGAEGNGTPAQTDFGGFVNGYIVSNKAILLMQVNMHGGYIVGGVRILRNFYSQLRTVSVNSGGQLTIEASGTTAALGVSLQASVSLNRVVLQYEDGPAIRVSTAATVRIDGITSGIPTGTGNAVEVEGFGSLIASATPVLGDAVATDYVLAGIGAINKGGLVNPGDGISGTSGSIVFE